MDAKQPPASAKNFSTPAPIDTKFDKMDLNANGLKEPDSPNFFIEEVSNSSQDSNPLSRLESNSSQESNPLSRLESSDELHDINLRHRASNNLSKSAVEIPSSNGHSDLSTGSPRQLRSESLSPTPLVRVSSLGSGGSQKMISGAKADLGDCCLDGKPSSLRPVPAVRRDSDTNCKSPNIPTRTSSTENGKTTPSAVFKDSLSLRARRHFQGTVDTQVTRKFRSVSNISPDCTYASPASGSPCSDDSGRFTRKVGRRADSMVGRGQSFSVNLPPIDPTTPSLTSVKKAIKSGVRLLKNMEASPNSSPTCGNSPTGSADNERKSIFAED